MAQVKALDTAFPDQHASLAIGAVAIVDGAAPGDELLKELLAERLPSIPRCTQLLQTESFEWIDCPGLDFAHHVHRVAVRRPGDDAELSRAIAHALERPLDLDRPLWECWVIEGLKGNRWAILMKVHHWLADGHSAAHLLTRLCDDADRDTFANHAGAKAAAAPQDPKRGWADALGRAAGLADTLVGAMWPPARPAVGAVTTMRKYGTVRVPRADVDRICRKFGVSVNDVALAAITEGFRTVLLGRGEQPRADSLRTLAPTPMRSAMLPYLPVEHEDPLQLLRAVQHQCKAGQTDEPGLGDLVGSAINLLPTMLRGNVLQLLARLPQRAIVTLATNAPGPRHRLRLMGRTLERFLPIPPTGLRLSTGVGVLSYGDEVVFGITGEYDADADVKRLAAGIELGVARLVALSQDSVLLFSKDRRRRRAARRHPSQAQRARPSTP
ncbi:wax ester/triacylglycerol synthase domain-containing protein [Mycobacterium sp. 1081908.1]|uniref:wax ester/triacylglycerol synthase domain-containing protein n=1 Tax=Mycobacterium sp. 1081908.1 TaxID=1834066 RepID=UPI0007FEE5DB|nr:wax ester/triacylglycerol synthase domain-containing protein [Mycobacterium sp. 1081908.1]OBK44172.1 diacylglycerol O-acyltransferase [Mycobacterium sp. 1081908.1]